MISAQISRSNCSKLLFFSFSAISCHRCENNSSLDECQKKQVDVDCPIPVHYCAKIKYESTTREGKIQTTYRKGCVTKDQCSATSGKIVDCCKGDKCNTSKKKLYFILETRIAERQFLTGLPRGYFFWGEGAVIHTQATIKPCQNLMWDWNINSFRTLYPFERLSWQKKWVPFLSGGYITTFKFHYYE